MKLTLEEAMEKVKRLAGRLDGILDYAEGMEPEEQYNFLCAVLPSLPESVIRRVEY